MSVSMSRRLTRQRAGRQAPVLADEVIIVAAAATVRKLEASLRARIEVVAFRIIVTRPSLWLHEAVQWAACAT